MPVPDVELVSSWAEVDAAAQAIANGVQKNQMAQSVRTSLGKADGAIQASAQAQATDWDTTEAAVDGSGKIVVRPSMSDEAKYALLGILEEMSLFVPDGLTRLEDLTAKLFPTKYLVAISADYAQDRPIYDTDDLDAIKAGDDLTVTANYSDGSSVVLADGDYTLSGTLTEGTSTITVSYGGKSTTISVVVTHVPTLDDIAYGTLTYRQMFLENNLLKYVGDFESDEIVLSTTNTLPASGVSYKVALGLNNMSISTDDCCSKTKSLKIANTASTQMVYNNSNATSGTKYLIAVAVKVTRYTAGRMGMQAGSPFSNASMNVTIGAQAVTDGWAEYVTVQTMPSNEFWAYFGSMSSANLDGYVDDIVATPVPAEMTQAEAEAVYSAYLNIRKGAAL